MATNTDAEWTARLNAILTNFNANYSGTFTAGANNLYATLYNRIGLTVVDGPDHAGGKFAKFNKSITDYGDTIQFIKSKVLTGQAYDPDAASPFGGSRNAPIAFNFIICKSCSTTWTPVYKIITFVNQTSFIQSNENVANSFT